MSYSTPVLISLAGCVVLFAVVVATFATLIPKDSAQNSKLLGVIFIFSIVASLAAYALAMYHFASNPTYLIHFILAIVMLVLLPAALISTSISTIAVSNLRDAIAVSV